MIGFTTIGTNNLNKSIKFYDELLSVIGVAGIKETERLKIYGTVNDQGSLAIIIPFNKKKHEPGNGNMVAINAENKKNIDSLYSKAIELGASSEGDPGERSPTFYGAYIRDLDGNKICFYCRP